MSIIEESKKAKREGFLGFFMSKKFIVLIVIIAVAAGAFYYFNRSKETVAEVMPKETAVNRGDIKISLESEGKVVAEDGVELSFSVSGDTLEVADVYVKEGDYVKKGDKIATVKTENLEFDRRSAYNNYQSALNSYNSKIAPPTEEEKKKALNSIEQSKLSLEQQKISFEQTKTDEAKKIKDAEAAIITAQKDLQTAQNNLDEAKKDLNLNLNAGNSEDVDEAYDNLANYIKSLDLSLQTILNYSDSILGIDNSYVNDSFELVLGMKNPSTLSKAKESYNKVKISLDNINNLAAQLNSGSSFEKIDSASKNAAQTLSEFQEHLYKAQAMLNNTTAAGGLTQTVLDGFISKINTNLSAVNTAISSLESYNKAINDAEKNLSTYEKSYNNYLIAYQKAEDKVKAAQEDLANIKLKSNYNIANAEKNLANKELALKQTELDYDTLMAPISAEDLAAAKTQLNSAVINLDKANYNLNQATLISPIDGEVAMLNYKKGDIILKDDTKPVVSIINNNTLFIEVRIEETDINKISMGQIAKATFDAIDELEIEGQVSFISLTAEINNNGIVTYLVRVLFENKSEAKIREGMTAFVEFIIKGVEDVLYVPVESVRNVDGKPSVQLASREWVPVVTGFTDGKNVEIISGLSEGERIIY